jgi:hypothetical protein
MNPGLRLGARALTWGSGNAIITLAVGGDWPQEGVTDMRLHRGWLRVWIVASVIWVIAAIWVQWDDLRWLLWIVGMPELCHTLAEPDHWFDCGASPNLDYAMSLVIAGPAFGWFALIVAPRVHAWIRRGFQKPYGPQ